MPLSPLGSSRMPTAPGSTGTGSQTVTDDGTVLDGLEIKGTLTVEVEGTSHILVQGDFIAYSSRRPHRFWNNGTDKVRTIWFNLRRD